MKHYDSIIIGAGQAGPFLADKLTSEGQKVAIVERHLFGGTCVNTGCIPTKTLVASAKVADLLRRSDEYGITFNGEVITDMKKVKARKDEMVGRSNKGITAWLKNMEHLDVFEGHGKFTNSNSVQVNGQTLESDKIFINVGARARVPNIPGINDIQYFTNTSVMDVDFVPEHLVIIGGSYIGLEFAQMYRRFGSKVTVIEIADRLLAQEDKDVSIAVQEILENEDIQIELEAECISFKKIDNKILVNFSCTNEMKEVIGSHVLMAVGRIPNTHDLGLENTEIEVNEHGVIVVDEKLQTNIPGIWALGECNGKGAFTHTAYNDHEIVTDQLFGSNTRSVDDRIPCYGVFIDPPLARIGLTEKQAEESGANVLVGKMMMSRIARAKHKGETQGFMKVLIDADTKMILGANILGVAGDEVIHLFLDIMYAKQSYEVIMNAVHIHPTVAELIPTMLQDLGDLSASLY